MKPFALVVAIDSKYGIGKDGQLPWHLPADLKHFKEITSKVTIATQKNAVVMGRKTWESLPEKFRPLPNRLNIVLTRDVDYALPPGVVKSISLEDALLNVPEEIDSIFVIGGGQVFKEAMANPFCQKLHLTHIKGDFNCDTFFPPIGPQFMLISASEEVTENNITYQFCDYWRS
jgi:dihydrofolate reductase/thymidylate synthase